MSSFRFLDINMLLLLWFAPMVATLFLYAAYKRRQALSRLFISANLADRLAAATINKKARVRKAFFVLLALILIVIALARPAWNEKETTIKRQGRDVVFLLDVSRSMLAEDLAPNRLERAKIAIRDCIETLQGDRVGLVVFAGSAKVKCPLTLDYGFFRLILDTISVNSVQRGGTMIGDALRTVMRDVFDAQATKYKDIVLITDGEDHESFPLDAAKTAADSGIRLIIVGLGDEKEGRRIPVTDEAGNRSFLKYNGREVWTKLDAETLRQMAVATPGGRYLPVATGDIDLGKVYMELIASAQKKELEASTYQKYEEKFQIFIAGALVLLMIEMYVSERKLKA